MRPKVGHYVKAVYAFAAQQSGELSLQVGDIVKVTDDIDGNWLQGETVYGGQGSFPSNFVEPLVLPDARMGQCVFVALADFPAEQADDLELTKGDIILGLEQVDGNWWKGKNGPLRGIFPLSCVQELDIVTEGPRSRSASLRCRSASLKSRADSLAQTSEMMLARALVDVVPQIEGELGFQTGDLITIKEIVDDDWFYGECHNKAGLVSTICVEFLDDFAEESEPSVGLEPSSGGDGGHVSVGEVREECIEDVGDTPPSVPSLPSHSGRRGSQNSVSYTSENTRSHDAEITPYAKTLFPFQAQLPTELSFGENEIVTLIQHVDEDWIEGELDGKLGLFPATFVEIIVDCPYAYDTTLPAESGDSESNKQETVQQNGHRTDLPSEEKSGTCDKQPPVDDVSDTGLALVLHDFSGGYEGDLSVKEGDTIEIVRVVDTDWLEARDECSTVGLVPRNHVQVIGSAPQSVLPASSTSSEESAPSKAPTDRSGTAVSVSQSLGEEGQEITEQSTAGSDSPDISVASSSPSSDLETSQVTSNHHSPQLSVSRHSSTSKPPPPLKPKPKLAPKPVLKPKPSMPPKATGSIPVAPKVPVSEGISLQTSIDAQNDSLGRNKKVFTDVDVGLSLDSMVQVQLEKAKSEGERSRGSSIIEEDSQSQSGSVQSTACDLRSVDAALPDPELNSSSSNSFRSPSPKVEARPRVVTEETADSSGEKHDQTLGISDTKLVRREGQTSSRPLSGSDLERLMPPSPNFLRSVSDNGVPAGSRGGESSVTSKASQRYSMPPSRPAPVNLRADGKGSFVNAGFEHESEGQLVSLEVTEVSRPPHPTRAVPCPPPPPAVHLTSGDLLTGEGERRVKRPPPRPTGPRIASVPSKTPLLPVKADGSKPVPHRPAPVAPATPRPSPAALATPRPSPVAPATSVSTPPVPPPASAIPPRPQIIAKTTPPKRPPPRLQKAPHDLMRFSPEPVIDEGEENMEELVEDLKNRLQENTRDIQKYEQSKRELEKKLGEPWNAEESERLETEESLQFVLGTLQELREEEKRLKGNLFSVSPREEKLEKARLLAEQRAADERSRREEEEKNAEEERGRRREKRQKVLQELVETEKDYLFDLQLCLTTFFSADSAIRVPVSVDIDFLFGNMEEIADVAQRLLTSLESAISGKAFQDQIIGSTFVALAEDMKNTYAPYCRHHDDVIAVMEKYRDIPEACQFFAAKVEEMRRRTNIFDVEAMLIKPVQRILKYPLLLHELLKSTENDHPDKSAINNAIRAMTDVATAINEYKRRKDLVFKYKRDSDQSFAMKIAKLNFHSIKKKSSRMRGRLSTNLGIGLQLRDENFEQEETRFRSAEKAVKVLLRNVLSYMDQMQEVIVCQENLAADISDYFGEKSCEEVSRYLTVHRELMSHYKTLTGTVEELVVSPLNRLVAMLNGPNNVIDKRFDKLLDYNNLLGRGKDEKLVQAAKKDYEAMNAQLLDELPRLYQLTLTLLQHCMAAYVRAQRDFQDHALKENCILLELPSVLGGSENVMENFNIRHTAALDQISMLSFIPRGFNPKMDAFRLDRRSSRQSFDTSKPPPTLPPSNQTDSQRVYLRQMYGEETLYQVTQTMPAHDLMDMAVTVGMLVAVIKDKDPMGGRQRWFVDDGVNKGFVQSSILAKPSSGSPTGSLSSLTAEDSDDLASVYSTSMDEGDALPWLTAPPSTSSIYPQVTQAEAPVSAAGQPATYEYYCAEYPFQGRSSNEVTMAAGQAVVVLSHQDLDGNAEWWLVDADGYQGYVPANYLRKM